MVEMETMTMTPEPASAMPADVEAWRPAEIDPDGWVVSEDGEILGRPDEGEWSDRPDPVTGEVLSCWRPLPDRCWAVRTDADAEAVLDRLGREEAAADAVATRRKAMLDRFDRLESIHRNRAAYIRRRFGTQLADLARSRLAGGRKRSYTLANGTIRFRTTRGTVRVVNMEQAVRWAEACRPELVRVKKDVLASEAAKAVEEDLSLGLIDMAPGWLEISGPGETVAIETVGVATALDTLGETSEWPAAAKGGAA